MPRECRTTARWSPLTSTLTPPVHYDKPLGKGISTAPAISTARGRRTLRALANASYSSALVALLLAIWEIAPRAGWVEPSLLPPLSKVARAWWKLAENGQLWSNTEASLKRSLAGFFLSVVFGVPAGVLIAWYSQVRRPLYPVLEVFRNTAVLALLPVFTLFLGIGETQKIAIVFFACIFPILLNTISGVQTVDPLLVRAARSLGFGSLALFRKVILPAAVPTIFTGVRMAGAASILVLVAAEFVGAKAGLGYLINYAQFNFMIPEMYAGIITIAAIGLLFNYTLIRLERRASRWRTDVRG